MDNYNININLLIEYFDVLMHLNRNYLLRRASIATAEIGIPYFQLNLDNK